MILILAAGPVAAKNSAPGDGQGKFGSFAMLPEGVSYPEGIAVNPNNGDIFVSTFNFAGNNKVLRYNHKGRLLAQVDLAATPLLGLAFNPAYGTCGGKVWCSPVGAQEWGPFRPALSGKYGCARLRCLRYQPGLTVDRGRGR
nr:hypothetical protein [uncultured Desulfobulbus sp.]